MIKDQIKLLLPYRRYICLDMVIVVCYYFTAAITTMMSIQLLITAIGIKYHILMDLSLFEPYLSTDSTILFCVSIFLIFSSILGILSASQYFYFGIITSIGLLVLLLGFTDVYAISNYRTKNYLMEMELYYVLFDALSNNPLENMALHVMQNKLACCGIDSYTDWLDQHGFIPGSCCENSTTICNISDPTLNTAGCLNVVSANLSSTYQNTVNIIIILNVIGVIAIYTGYFYSYLIRQLKKDGRILRTVIPRIQMHNSARAQQTGQNFNLRNNTSNIQVTNDQNTPSAPTTIYPNLYAHESVPNL